MKRATAFFTSACVIFTLLTLGLYIAEAALGSGMLALGRQLLLLLACLLFTVANRILTAERLPLGVRILLHYLAVVLIFFSVLGVIGQAVTRALQLLVLLVCITVLYLLFAAVYLSIRRRAKQEKENEKEYKSIF